MSPRAQSTVGDTLLALSAAAAAAIVLGLALAAFSAAPDMKGRLEALNTRTERIQTLLRQAPSEPVGPLDSLCHQDPMDAAKHVHDAITALAAQSNVTLDVVDTRPESPSDGASALTPIRLRFAVTGSYENVVALLAAVSRQKPLVFVDSLDLTPKVSNVTAQLAGRSFCAV